MTHLRSLLPICPSSSRREHPDLAQADGDAPCYLAMVATWADKICFHACWSSPLHFIGSVGEHPLDDY